MGLEGGRCPKGSKKDTRKKSPNPSGCRRSPAISPRRSYVRQNLGVRQFNLLDKWYQKDKLESFKDETKKKDFLKHYKNYKKMYH
jgi:hypothetical protein